MKLGEMGGDDSMSPDDITGVNVAQEVLSLSRDSTEEEIQARFEAKCSNSEDDEYWLFLKAREVALAHSVIEGTAVYNVLRDDPRPGDIISVADAQNLLEVAPPSTSQRGNSGRYERGLRRVYEYVRGRLTDLVGHGDVPVSEKHVETVDVAYYALHFRDLNKGRRWVIGPKNEREQSSSGQETLVTGWRYSFNVDDGTEYYVSNDREEMITIETGTDRSNGGYSVTLRRNDSEVSREIHSRYGNAKRQVKRWILEEGSLDDG